VVVVAEGMTDVAAVEAITEEEVVVDAVAVDVVAVGVAEMLADFTVALEKMNVPNVNCLVTYKIQVLILINMMTFQSKLVVKIAQSL
jgi:hypothetical protein